jgi:hypothetical protein
MKKYRYIFIPFEIGVLSAIMFFFLYGGITNPVWGFVVGSLFGFGMLAYNDYKVKKLSPKDVEKALEVRPVRKVVLFTNFDKAFDLCLESVGVLRRGKVKKSNRENGLIVARMGMNWNTFGSKFTYKLKTLTDLTTEIEIEAKPIVSGTKVDYGENYQAIENLVEFLDEKNQQMNIKHLSEKNDIPVDFYTNISSKNKISAK